MSQLILLDSGYLSDKNLAGQTQLDPEDRAGFNGTTSVTSFLLDTTGDNTFASAANVENKSVIDNFNNNTTSLVSVANEQITISFTTPKKLNNTLYQYSLLHQLNRLKSTRGLKLLYLSDVNEIDSKMTSIQALGQHNINGNFAATTPTDTDGTVATNMPYLVVRVTSVSIADKPSNTRWVVTISCVVEGSS